MMNIESSHATLVVGQGSDCWRLEPVITLTLHYEGWPDEISWIMMKKMGDWGGHVGP